MGEVKPTDTPVPSERQVRHFRRQLIQWASGHTRQYPWRETEDPFRILIAEMMLRRTRADQVVRVYENLLKSFPDIHALAEADPERVKAILYPLGLRWRTPAFVGVARVLRDRYNGQVPSTREALLSLPGVGEYVAGAVLAIAYRKNEWVVDSNIARVFVRHFGLQPRGEPRRDKTVIQIARIYAAEGDNRKATLAILDFSRAVCSPLRPRCEKCPVLRSCSRMSHPAP